MKIIHRTGNSELARDFARPPSVEQEVEFCKLIAVEELLQFMKRQGISRTNLAQRLGVAPSRITAMLSGDSNLTIETLVRAGRAVGGELKIHFQPAKKAGTAATPDVQTQAPSRTVHPTGKKSKSSPASKGLKPAKGKSGSIASKSLNPDESIHRVAENSTPYGNKQE